MAVCNPRERVQRIVIRDVAVIRNLKGFICGNLLLFNHLHVKSEGFVELVFQMRVLFTCILRSAIRGKHGEVQPRYMPDLWHVTLLRSR